jgi:hypothetical protein
VTSAPSTNTSPGSSSITILRRARFGRTVSPPVVNIWRVRYGRIVERWGRLDELGLPRQLGLHLGCRRRTAGGGDAALPG